MLSCNMYGYNGGCSLNIPYESERLYVVSACNFNSWHQDFYVYYNDSILKHFSTNTGDGQTSVKRSGGNLNVSGGAYVHAVIIAVFAPR